MREMNLLPEEYLYEQEQKRRKRMIIGTIITFILVLLISYLVVYFIEYNMRREIHSVKSEIESLEKVRETQLQISASQDVLEERLAILEKIENQRVDHFQFIHEIRNALPRELVLESITHPSGTNFTIRGIANNPEKIADVIVNLAKIEGVENVLLDSVNYGDKEDSEQDPSFSINFTYPREEGGQENDESNQ